MNTLLTATIVSVVVAAMIIGKILKKLEGRDLEIKQERLKSKRMANAEPECSRCLICGKMFADGGTFRLYKGKWFCFDCYKWVKQLKNEADFNKACKEFNVEAKAGEE